MAYRTPPWELEQQISSAWFTTLRAFRNEYTLDPPGARASAIIARMNSLDSSSKLTDFIDRIEYVTQAEIDQQQLNAALLAWPEEK